MDRRMANRVLENYFEWANKEGPEYARGRVARLLASNGKDLDLFISLLKETIKKKGATKNGAK